MSSVMTQHSSVCTSQVYAGNPLSSLVIQPTHVAAGTSTIQETTSAQSLGGVTLTDSCVFNICSCRGMDLLSPQKITDSHSDDLYEVYCPPRSH